MQKKKKVKIVYLEDKGDTIYSMAPLEGRTPEEQEEYNKKRKNRVLVTGKERWAMFQAALSVYGPLLLICVGSFFVVALLMYLYLR
jgi:hypothetical protein